MYFENENNYLPAGKFYLLSEYYERALKLFMRCSSATKDAEHIILAIDTVGQARNEKLSRLLLDYLLGAGPDGESKEKGLFFHVLVTSGVSRISRL